jgi:hypothetical protein
MSVSAPCCLVLARAVLPGNEGDGGAAPCALASRSPASPGTGTTSGSRSSRRQMAATPGNSGRRTCMRRATSGSGSTGSSVRPMRCALRSVVRVLISTRRVGAGPCDDGDVRPGHDLDIGADRARARRRLPDNRRLSGRRFERHPGPVQRADVDLARCGPVLGVDRSSTVGAIPRFDRVHDTDELHGAPGRRHPHR